MLEWDTELDRGSVRLIFNNMVKYEASLDATFGALSHPVRRAVLERLARGQASVLQLAEPFDCSLPAVSRHLQVLEQAGLVTREREGRVHRLSLRAEPLDEAEAWIERRRVFWEKQLDSLAEYLTETREKQETDDDRASHDR